MEGEKNKPRQDHIKNQSFSFMVEVKSRVTASWKECLVELARLGLPRQCTLTINGNSIKICIAIEGPGPEWRAKVIGIIIKHAAQMEKAGLSQ